MYHWGFLWRFFSLTQWGATSAMERGPIIASTLHAGTRNAVGAHGGSYSIYRSLAVASGALDPAYRPDYSLTTPAAKIGPYPSWFDPKKVRWEIRMLNANTPKSTCTY